MPDKQIHSLPMAYAAMLGPIVQVFEQRGGDLDGALRRVGFDRSSLERDLLPVQPCYDLMEDMAHVLEDPCFCYGIGADTPFPQLPNMRLLRTDRAALGELLTALIVDAKRLTSLASYSLSISAESAIFAQHRNFRPVRPPRQADGFLAGLILRVIHETIGGYWNPAQVKLRVSSARAIPPILPSGVINSNSRADLRIVFPADWLLVRQGGTYVQKAILQSVKFPDLVGGVRELLKLRLSDPNVRTEEIAGKLMISKRVFQSELAKAGTTLRQELVDLRKSEACRRLQYSELSITEIGKAVGYPDPASFSRAFRRWVGVSPSHYRIEQAEL